MKTKITKYYLVLILISLSTNLLAQRIRGGSRIRVSETKASASERKNTEKPLTERTSVSTSRNTPQPSSSITGNTSSQLASQIKRDLGQKTQSGSSKSVPSINNSQPGNLTARNSGKLNLYKFKSPQSYDPQLLSAENYSLYLPNKGSAQLNWKQNSARLRSAISLKKPISDSYRDQNGNLLPTSGFLKAERQALQAKKWSYDKKIGSWVPPLD